MVAKVKMRRGPVIHLSPSKIAEINKSLIYYHTNHGDTIKGNLLVRLYEHVHNISMHHINSDSTYKIYVRNNSYVLITEQNQL